MRIAVFGLWHLGCVTGACLAEAGHDVVGLDLDQSVVDGLRRGTPPLFEPGLPELISSGAAAGRITFTTDPASAIADAEILWVTFDTPVNERDEADVGFVRQRLEEIAPVIRPETLILISSQVPVGFTRSLSHDWGARDLRFAYSPENLRLGKAIEVLRSSERIVVGLEDEADREALRTLLSPFTQRIEWMTLESAEMTKHALNAFLATSVTFINEIARLCEAVGADAKEVERGLKSEGRIGPRAYLSPGPAIAGGTLARDVRFLVDFGFAKSIETPLLHGVLESNERHKGWLRTRIEERLDGDDPIVAVLGLTYKPGTSTLRRSSSVELCEWLHARRVRVQAHDPAVSELPAELRPVISLAADARAALAGADLAVIATEWPEYRELAPADFLETMRVPQVLDQTWFLEALANDARIAYVAPGRPATIPKEKANR
jgi:UDPglucose 6-dehydrogenase